VSLALRSGRPTRRGGLEVWKDLCEVLSHPESITDALQRARGGQWLPQELKVRQENLRQGRVALERQLERPTEAYLGEVIPLAEYQRRRQDLERRDAALAAQERQPRAQSHRHMKLAGMVGSVEDFCERVRSGLANATFEQRRKLVELSIDRVIVTEEEVEIRYVIPTVSSSEQVRFCHLRSDYLDGLITNDKFCFTRRSRLKLRPKRRGYPLRKGVRRGGIDEEGLDRSAHDGRPRRRRPSLGSGLPAPPLMGGREGSSEGGGG
jgi:hypothetical protein